MSHDIGTRLYAQPCKIIHLTNTVRICPHKKKQKQKQKNANTHFEHIAFIFNSLECHVLALQRTIWPLVLHPVYLRTEE